MLRALSGNTHTVMTGVAIIDKDSFDETILFYDVSYVTFHVLNDERIKRYISDNNCLDKAGAYAVQDAGSSIISDISGSWWNVVGFPLEAFEKRIKEKKYASLFIFPEKYKNEKFCVNYITDSK